jgi:hypothetical protein
MFRLSFLFVIAPLISSVAFGQTDDADRVAAAIGRISSTLGIVNQEAGNSDSELEIVTEQKTQIGDLMSEYRELVQYHALSQREGKSSPELNKEVADKLAGLEERLHDQVLLPHQSDLLRAKVFNFMVSHHKGSALKAVVSNFRTEFGLSDEQLKRLNEIQKSTSTEVAELRKKFENELKALQQRALTEAETVLTPDQVQKLRRFQRDVKRAETENADNKTLDQSAVGPSNLKQS